jgi:hypothetical protein
MDSSVYRSLGTEGFSSQLISFFSEEEGSRDSIESSRVLRDFIAKGLEDQTFDAYLGLAADKPKEFYQVFETVSRAIESGELKKFFDRIRRSLSDGKR